MLALSLPQVGHQVILRSFEAEYLLLTCVTDTSDPGWENTVQVFPSPLQNRTPFPIFLMAADIQFKRCPNSLLKYLQRCLQQESTFNFEKYSSKRKIAFAFRMQFGQGIQRQNLEGLGNFSIRLKIGL